MHLPYEYDSTYSRPCKQAGDIRQETVHNVSGSLFEWLQVA